MSARTRMDHRAELLASMIKHRVQVLVVAIRPEGAPAPFTDQQTNEEALAFWRKNRYTPVGQKYLAGLSPTQIMELDGWLARHPDPALPPVTPGA